MTQPFLLDAHQAAAFLGMSLRHFRDASKADGFPTGRALGPRNTRWVRGELEAYALALPMALNEEPECLKVARAARKSRKPMAHAPFPPNPTVRA